MTAEGAGLSPALLILIDSNPDAPFVPPGNMTGPTDQAVGLDDQFEPVWTFNGTAPFVLRQINYHDIFRKARAQRSHTNEAPYLLRHSVSSIDLMIRPPARRARNLSIANSSIWSRWILKTSRAAISG